MTLYDIEQWYSKAIELLRQQRVYETIEYLAKQSTERFQPRLDDIRFTYNNILAYTGKGISDPLGDEIYSKLMASVYELADAIKLHMVAGSGSKLAAIKADLDKLALRENEDLSENLMGLSFDNELQEILRSASLFDDESESESAKNHRQAISRSFYNLWLTDKFSENDEQVITNIFNSASIPWFEKSMMISALTLGSLRTFDSRRISLLIDLYGHPDYQINQRALFGVLISVFLYDKRFQYYPRLKEKLVKLSFEPSFRDDTLGMMTQFYRSKDTERVSKKLTDEILPQVIKFNEDLNEKLDLEKLLQSGDPMDKNPDWEKYFDSQPGLTRKLEELTEMQMEGVDVFISAFAQLKNFPFFSDAPNWFIPFYPENFAVQDALSSESENFRQTFLKGLDLSMYMCNSDKFSFALNLRFMPEPQKNMMIQMFDSEGEQLAELKNEELSDPALAKKRISIQYIQDLYRFFKLHPLRNETGDIFIRQFEVHESTILTNLIADYDFYRIIGNFYFDNNHFIDALKVFDWLIAKDENYAELYEKAGYCHQMLGDYLQAINLYERADLFDTNHNWLLRKMAQCYMALNDTEAALEKYLELSTLEPDNQSINASIGTCYLNLERPDEAIEYFYRIEFANPGTPAALRPVAWCLFLLNRTEDAAGYYDQLLGMEPNFVDFLNAGHVALCTGEKEKSINYYRSSIRLRPEGIRSFVKSYNKDRKHLLANGVKSGDIALLLDYLRFGKPNSFFV